MRTAAVLFLGRGSFRSGNVGRSNVFAGSCFRRCEERCDMQATRCRGLCEVCVVLQYSVI